MTIALHLDALADRFARIIAPAPPPRPITEFARTLRPGEGRTRDEGRQLLRPTSHAPQWYALRAFESSRYRSILTIGPTGDGKSLATINIPILHALFECGDDVVYGGPTRQLLNKLFRTKIVRLITASGYARMLPKEGPGSGGGVADVIRFANGSHLFPIGGGGKGESAQAGVHARWGFYEEYDDMDPHEIALVGQRTSAHGLEARHVKTTTIKRDRGSRTIGEYASTTRCRVEFACPSCSRFQLWRWAQISPATDWTSTKAAAATVQIVCRHCGTMLSPAGHQASLERHRLVTVLDGGETSDEIPDIDEFGLWWGSLDSTRKGLQYLAVRYQQALVARERHFNHEPMRQFYRDELAEPYLDEDLGEAAAITDEVLGRLARASTYLRGQVPVEFGLIVAGEDCQLRSHYWLMLAVRWNSETQRVRWAIVDWGELSVCGAADQPTVEQRHATLDQVDAIAEGGYQYVDSSRRVACPIGAVDTAYHPREVRPWVARHRRRWLSMRGCGQDQFGRMRDPRRGSVVLSVKGALIVYEQDDTPDRLQGFAEASALNDVIEADLHSGDGMIPQDADNKLAFHLLGIRRGGPDDKEPWVEVHRRHDWRDCLLYALSRAYQFFNHPPSPSSSRSYGVVGTIIRK